MKKAKIDAAITIALFLASMLSMTVTPTSAGPADMPPKGPHYDLNFVTGGKIAFTSTFEGTTTPTAPPSIGMTILMTHLPGTTRAGGPSMGLASGQLKRTLQLQAKVQLATEMPIVLKLRQRSTRETSAS